MFESLFAKRAEHIKPGLERMFQAYRDLDLYKQESLSVLVAGTNGKGSTAGFLWSLINLAGWRVGLFSSPHLVHFSERYFFSHRDFNDIDVQKQHKLLKSRISEDLYQQLSFFEVAALIAMQAFANERNHLNIFEVGLGGRWDATNIVEAQCAVIVSIAKDHEKFLGNTIEEITLEKAGIIKEGKPVFLGNFFATKAGEKPLRIIREVAASHNAEVFLSELVEDLNNEDFLAARRQFQPLWSRSDVLQQNFLLAYQVFCYLRDFLSNFPEEKANKLKIPPTLVARYQSLVLGNRQNKELIVDVCHNAAGVEELVKYVSKKSFPEPIPALVSILADKDINLMLDLLQGIFSPIVLFKIDNIRSFDAGDIDQRHRQIEIFDDFDSAWRFSIAKWDVSKPWVVCGSVAAVGEVIGYFSADKNFADEFVLDGIDPSL